ncbi:MAG: magnesium transporter [Pseudomonadota bacterium]
MADTTEARPHHAHLEQARTQVIELLNRQAVEREWMARSVESGDKQTVVSSLVTRQQQAALETRLSHFHPADIAFVLESLPPEARQEAWRLVRPERRGAVLLEAANAVCAGLIRNLPLDEIVSVVRPLASQDIADVLSELPDELRQQVLGQLDRSDQAEVRTALSFPAGSIGAVMAMDFLSVREDTTLEAVHRLLRRQKQLPPHTSEIIVVDRGNTLRGVLALDKLLLEEPETLVSGVMALNVTYFYTDDPVKDAVESFEKYDLISAPVVNLHQQVVGRITVDTVLDEVKQRAESESLRQVGLSEDEDLFAPVIPSAKNRWPWLALNLLTAFIASRVIGAFEGIIVQLVALAALMPIVASIGGNTGNQTVALVIRGLALDQLGPSQLRAMLRKEFAVATVNGLMWGSVLGFTTLLVYQQWALSLVIGSAVLLNLWVAAAGGVFIPLTLQRFGRDPVMGSSVLLTALTDSMGFFIFLGLAAIFLV